MEDKNKKIAIIAFIFSILAIGSSAQISNILTGLYCTNCTLDNPTFINFTFPNGSGAGDHFNLTNLTISSAGHIFDDSIEFTIEEGYVNNSNSNCGLLVLGNGSNRSQIFCNDAITSHNSYIENYPDILNLFVRNTALSTQSTYNQDDTHVSITVENITSGNNAQLYIDENGFSMNNQLDMQNNSIVNANLISNGSYDGDGTINRFISHSLQRLPVMINIVGNLTTGNYIGQIIQPGQIDTVDGTRISVDYANTTGFFVSGLFNNFGGNVNGSVGGNTLNTGNQENLIRLMPITPLYSGQIITIGVNIQSAAGNIRMAIYNDTGGVPDVLLNETGSIAAVNGWNNASLIVNMNASSQYWIGYNFDNINNKVYYINSGTSKFKTWAYGAFQNPVTGLSTGTTTMYMSYSIDITPTKYYWVAQ